jgi:hypothetical protein
MPMISHVPPSRKIVSGGFEKVASNVPTSSSSSAVGMNNLRTKLLGSIELPVEENAIAVVEKLENKP